MKMKMKIINDERKNNYNLSKEQEQLVNEIKEILFKEGLEINAILDKSDHEAKTILLKLAKDQFITSIIIKDYTLIDESLCEIIKVFFFGKVSKQNIKSIQIFNSGVLEKLYLLNKLELVKEIIEVPNFVINFIHSLNDLRNGVAHSFMPEARKKNRPFFKKKNIFEMEGYYEFRKECDKVLNYLIDKAWSDKGKK